MNLQYENLTEQYSAKSGGYYEISRAEMLPFVPDISTSVLDIGCGTGEFGKLLKDQRPGTIVWGIEPDTVSAKAAADKLDRVVHGTFSPTLPDIAGKTFDAICLNDVLEHLVSPEETLHALKSFLSPNGSIVASIPNILFFYQILEILKEQDWRYRDAGILDNTHLRFFTKKSIIRMFEECGYHIVRIEGINGSYGLKYKVLNFLTLGHLKDWKHVQFAVQAKPKLR